MGFLDKLLGREKKDDEMAGEAPMSGAGMESGGGMSEPMGESGGMSEPMGESSEAERDQP